MDFALLSPAIAIPLLFAIAPIEDSVLVAYGYEVRHGLNNLRLLDFRATPEAGDSFKLQELRVYAPFSVPDLL